MVTHSKFTIKLKRSGKKISVRKVVTTWQHSEIFTQWRFTATLPSITKTRFFIRTLWKNLILLILPFAKKFVILLKWAKSLRKANITQLQVIKMKINIVNAFNWACNVLDTEKLKPTEQATLFHILKLLNRNFWKPCKITPYILKKHTGSDDRTIKNALKTLFDKKILLQLSEEGVYINIDDEEKLRKKFGIKPEKPNSDKPKPTSTEFISEQQPDSKSNSRTFRTLQDAISNGTEET